METGYGYVVHQDLVRWCDDDKAMLWCCSDDDDAMAWQKHSAVKRRCVGNKAMAQ